MGMETLNNAARAAGYAMATSDDLLSRSKSESRPESEAWRPGEAIMPSQVTPPTAGAVQAVSDWVKGRLFSVLGRDAPA
jgi:hypothetical protein